VVVLESSVLAQGLPFPENLASARACAAAVRAAGAVPAVVAVVDGRVRCGLASGEVEALARGAPPARKVGARDLAPAVAKGASAGTTVSATCAVAAALGLPVFATGGIGGVHPGGTGDVSEDLQALSRFAGMVVCAGAKSVLDRTGDFPGFYTRSSGLRLTHRVEDVASAARLLGIHRERLGQRGALLLCVPPPAEVALEEAEVKEALRAAHAEVVRQGVQGQALTPFLLRDLARATSGRTLTANLALLEQNARLAAEVAVAYARPGAGQ